MGSGEWPEYFLSPASNPVAQPDQEPLRSEIRECPGWVGGVGFQTLFKRGFSSQKGKGGCISSVMRCDILCCSLHHGVDARWRIQDVALTQGTLVNAAL